MYANEFTRMLSQDREREIARHAATVHLVTTKPTHPGCAARLAANLGEALTSLGRRLQQHSEAPAYRGA